MQNFFLVTILLLIGPGPLNTMLHCGSETVIPYLHICLFSF